VIEANSLAGLADALIKSRIARGWTQRRLAETLGVAEQQVQRYESSAYRSASLARLCGHRRRPQDPFTERAELQDPDAA
jgi:HTH-type transcriptional regulator/antitoxin HigA